MKKCSTVISQITDVIALPNELVTIKFFLKIAEHYLGIIT